MQPIIGLVDGTENNSGNGSLTTATFSVDRSRALVRGLWRAIPAGVGVAIAVTANPSWRLLWLTERAAFLAWGFLYLIVAAATIGFIIAAVRWTALAAWGGPLGITVTPDFIVMRLGPFGQRQFDWRRIRVEINADVDMDMLDLMPDEAFVPRLRHPTAADDLAAMILQFARVTPQELTRMLRPFIRRAMTGASERSSAPLHGEPAPGAT